LRSHLRRRTHFPFLGELLDFFVGGKICRVRFAERRVNFRNLPLVVINIGADRFGREKRLGAFGRPGESLEAFLYVVFEADGHGGGHNVVWRCAEVCTFYYNELEGNKRREEWFWTVPGSGVWV